MGRRITKTFGPLLARTHKIKRNINLAFPEMTDAEVDQLAREVWGNLGAVLAEERKIKPLSLNGISPLTGGRVNPAYPMFKPLFFVAPLSPRPHVRAFMEFVWSETGDAFLTGYGHMPIVPDAGTLNG